MNQPSTNFGDVYRTQTAAIEMLRSRVSTLRLAIAKAIECLTLPGSSAAERDTAKRLRVALARDDKEVPR